MLFDDLTESAKENAVQAFSDYFDDEVSQRMLESIGNLEATRFIDVDVSKDADGAFSLDAEKRKTPCFADGNDVPPKPERLKQTDDTVDQLFCEEYNKAVRSLASSWNDIQGAMKRHPDALAALKADDRFMTAWEEDVSDYGDALDAATDDDAEFARLGKEFKAMNSDVEDAVDDFADDDLKATQDALDRVAEVLSDESERYRTQDGVSKLSQEMGVDFDEDGEPTNLFEKTSSKSGDVEYALTRRVPAPVEMQEDTGVCPLCHSDAFDGRYCPVCGFHSDRADDGDEAGGKAGTLAYMLKSGTRKTAQGYDGDDKRGNNMKASQMRKRSRTGSTYEEWPPTDCDTVNEAISIIELNAPHRNHFALSDFVNSVMGDKCRTRYNVLDLAEHYGVLPDSGELIRLFWNKFWDEVWSYLDEDDLLKNEFDWSSIGVDPDSLDDYGDPIDSSTTASSACGRGRNRKRRVR